MLSYIMGVKYVYKVFCDVKYAHRVCKKKLFNFLKKVGIWNNAGKNNFDKARIKTSSKLRYEIIISIMSNGRFLLKYWYKCIFGTMKGPSFKAGHVSS